MSMFERELKSTGKLKDLPAIIEFVEESLVAAGVDPNLQFDIVLAVEEACSNVIEHAYRGKGGELRLLLQRNGNDLKITVRDRGRPFKPESIARPDMNVPLDQRPLGGLGMHLMYQLMDDIRYDFQPDGNTLLMIKRNVLPTSAGPSDG